MSISAAQAEDEADEAADILEGAIKDLLETFRARGILRSFEAMVEFLSGEVEGLREILEQRQANAKPYERLPESAVRATLQEQAQWLLYGREEEVTELARQMFQDVELNDAWSLLLYSVAQNSNGRVRFATVLPLKDGPKVLPTLVQHKDFSSRYDPFKGISAVYIRQVALIERSSALHRPAGSSVVIETEPHKSKEPGRFLGVDFAYDLRQANEVVCDLAASWLRQSDQLVDGAFNRVLIDVQSAGYVLNVCRMLPGGTSLVVDGSSEERLPRVITACDLLSLEEFTAHTCEHYT